ncbi:MAG: hypothetical protein UX35_C0006G0024 [Microgenomates group bacterium GW2011_GWA1_46_15]|nr:MAG: hypothetical protein UX00_C0007G0124 [Microgenomates group bacterium GW2011_GWB1_45_17]KKU23348.1 MAG: hypothetical protein UX35_C0006G0024 [Microgenomates group bacterium GW2011_GWA1_46_15]KKU24523.1 MAG: hypothetical protein UX36_C0001G0140 [Microgenomates group bacterium GW2011_GWC1_46_15]
MDRVGSFVNNHGIIASKAAINIMTSDLVMSLLPYLKEISAMKIVSSPVTPVVHEPAPPPLFSLFSFAKKEQEEHQEMLQQKAHQQPFFAVFRSSSTQ